MKAGFFEVHHSDGTIERSMGRLLAFWAAAVGTGIVVTALVLKDAGIVGIGAGLFSTGELLKYGQKRSEAK